MPALPEPGAASDGIPNLNTLPLNDDNAFSNSQPAPLLPRDPSLDILASDSLNPPQPLSATIQKRAIPSIIPSYYNNDGPGAGTVVGIVLGSVGGFLLVIWLLFSLFNFNGRANIAGEEEIVVRRRRGSGSHAQRSRRSTRTEVREYSRSPARRGSRTIVEERRRSGGGGRRSGSFVVDERRVPGDDVVEVIEEHDDYVRRGSRRGPPGGYR